MSAATAFTSFIALLLLFGAYTAVLWKFLPCDHDEGEQLDVDPTDRNVCGCRHHKSFHYPPDDDQYMGCNYRGCDCCQFVSQLEGA